MPDPRRGQVHLWDRCLPIILYRWWYRQECSWATRYGMLYNYRWIPSLHLFHRLHTSQVLVQSPYTHWKAVVRPISTPLVFFGWWSLSVAVAGSAIKWLRDSMMMIPTAEDVNRLAKQVPSTGGLYFVTAFSGLLAPYWDPGAAGMLIGMIPYSTSQDTDRS